MAGFRARAQGRSAFALQVSGTDFDGVPIGRVGRMGPRWGRPRLERGRSLETQHDARPGDVTLPSHENYYRWFALTRCKRREGRPRSALAHAPRLPIVRETFLGLPPADEAHSMATAVKKVVLAYSGGLDTSIILKWLQETYGCEVVTFTADLGQGEELEPARKKAEMLGIKEIFVEDLREEFVRDFVFPMFRANALYEGVYLLGTSIARPLIAKRQIEIAKLTGADAVSHGATGKGNDQVRFELDLLCAQPGHQGDRALARMGVQVATDLIDFAEKHQIPVAKDKRGEAPFSVDANLLHSSSEGKVLEDPGQSRRLTSISAPSRQRTRPTRPTVITIGFEKGDPVSIDGKKLSPAALLTRLNELGRDNGIGRVDLVENRYVGMKIARRVRDAGRHHPARRAPRHRIAHARPRGDASEGRADAALCGADLLRLLVLARARDAAGADRQEPGACRRRGQAQALQGQRHRHRPLEPEIALRRARSSPSRTMPAPTTRRTRKASSSSTRSACGCSANAADNSLSLPGVSRSGAPKRAWSHLRPMLTTRYSCRLMFAPCGV